MGCGVSRLNLMDQGMACGLRSPLRRTLVDFHNTDVAASPKSGTGYTKLLLNDSASEENTSSHSAPKNASIHDPPVLQKINTNEKPSAREENVREENHVDDNDDDEEDDNGRRISNYDGSLWIGSPSFREYCVQSDSEDNSGVNHDDYAIGTGKEEAEDTKRETIDKVETQNVEKYEYCIDEVCVLPERSRTKEQGEKESSTGGGRLRKVLLMHRPNFWYGRRHRHGSTPKVAEKVV